MAELDAKSTENEANCLSDADLQERVDAFRAGPRTPDAAAECGLLALAVPVAFGGLFVSRARREAFHALLYRLPETAHVRAQILAHLAVCQHVLDAGTPAQYDLFLPQLAAGKRVGLLTKTPIGAERLDAETYRLSGRTTPLTNLPPAALVLVRAALDGETRMFLLPHELVRPDWNTPGDSYHFVFAGRRVPRAALLGEGLATPATTARWEATRWNSDRFAP